MTGVGVVGAGIIFEQHAAAVAAEADRARIVAVADVDEAARAAAAAAHRVPFTYADHRSLLERDDVDIVVVATPPCLHEQVVADALRAGKLVLCEKPLAHTLEAADRIVAIADEFPGRLSVVHQFRWLPEVRRTIWLRDAGELGALRFGRLWRYARFRRAGKAPRRAWWGRWDVAGGGVVMTQLIHELDLACHVFGEPVEVSATIETFEEAIESEDTCSATVRFAGGAVVSLHGTMCAHKSTAGFDVVGARASAHSPWKVESLDRDKRDELKAEARERFPDAEPVSDHAPYVSAVLDAIDEGRPLPVGPREARRAVELCAAIYESGLTGARVTLPLDSGSHVYAGVRTSDYAEARA
jgi:UDP-N-acetyl-2-amino-2-deoxyglucuronate dehydrogenase